MRIKLKKKQYPVNLDWRMKMKTSKTFTKQPREKKKQKHKYLIGRNKTWQIKSEGLNQK